MQKRNKKKKITTKRKLIIALRTEVEQEVVRETEREVNAWKQYQLLPERTVSSADWGAATAQQ